jgi:CPA2 family monovalent cation:H+ antiporter-2
VIRVILLDAVLLIAVLIGANVEIDRLTTIVANVSGLTPDKVRVVIALIGGLIIIPLVYGIVTSARALGTILGRRAFNAAERGRVDPANAPRGALVVLVQLAVVVAVGIPVVAITQPFLPPHQGAAVLAILTSILLIALWRNATNLQGHARAGAQIIASALATQMASADEAAGEPMTLEDVNAVIPGLGEPVAIRVVPESVAVGRSLAQLNLRGATGATVLAIRRGETLIPNPLGREVIREGDLLAVAGSYDATAIARQILAPNLARLRADAAGAEIEAELEALNNALLVEHREKKRSFFT